MFQSAQVLLTFAHYFWLIDFPLCDIQVVRQLRHRITLSSYRDSTIRSI